MILFVHSGYMFKIEKNKLYMSIIMRSNDCVFGYDNDWAFADYVHERMLGELKKTYPDLEKGEKFWHAQNFHCYPRHFKYLEEIYNKEGEWKDR